MTSLLKQVPQVLAGLIVGGIIAALFLAAFLIVDARGAELVTQWTHDRKTVDGDTILTGLRFEVFIAGEQCGATDSLFYDFDKSDTSLSAVRIRATTESGSPSGFTRPAFVRVVTFEPDFSAIITGKYPDDSTCIAVVHPHSEDSLLVAHAGETLMVMCWVRVDFTGDEWLNLSDLAELGWRIVRGTFNPGWGMFRISGGDVTIFDLAVLGAMFNGPAREVRTFTSRPVVIQ